MNETVKTVVTKVAEHFRVQVKAQLVAQHRATIADYQSRSAEKGKTCVYEVYPDRGVTVWEARSAHYKREAIKPFLTYEHNDKWLQTTPRGEQLLYSVAANVEEIIEKRAEDQSKRIIESFVEKMTAKFTGIAENKGDLDTVVIGGAGHLTSHDLFFTFKDGSRFSVSNDIILNHSVNGTPFNQFPTRFYDVILRGTALKSPSEARVKKEFK